MDSIILAGGLGTRLRAAVPDLPKPMAPVSGRPFLEHLLDYWIRQGVTRFILSVGYRHEAILAHFGLTYHGIPIRYAIENKPLGTGGGLLLAGRSVAAPGPFLVLNGDTYFEARLEKLREFHAARRAQVTLALFRSPQQGRYAGLCIEPTGEVRALGTSKAGELANGGVYVMERNLLEGGPWLPSATVSLEEEILPFALREGRRVYGLECPGAFLDIGVPEDYARAADVLGA